MTQTLIERLEKATGPSRELDKAIELSFGSIPNYAGYCSATDSMIWHEHHEAGGAPITQQCEAPLPHFTSSLDAALNLVPEGYFWSCGHNPEPDDDTPSEFGAMLCRYWHVSDKSDTSAVGASPAIALCIAILKARQVQP